MLAKIGLFMMLGSMLGMCIIICIAGIQNSHKD